MRALQLTRIGLLELVDLPEPEAGEDEDVFDVVAAGICGSDVHGVNGGFLREPPVVMGHEFAVRDALGRAYAVNPLIACGACDACARGRDHLCAHRTWLGMHRAGGFAERVAIPRQQLVELPPGTPADSGALVEPLSIALHAWRLVPPGASQRIAILGAGAIGLGVLLMALADRPSDLEVDVAEPDPVRRGRAADLGAASVGDRLVGTYEVIVDAVGSPETHAASIAHLSPGGLAVWVGNVSGEASFDARLFVRSEMRVVGSTASTAAEFAEAAARVHLVPLDAVEFEPLHDGVAAFDRLAGGPRDALKTLLRP